MSVTKVWSTPNGEQLLGFMARVSNPNATPDQDASRLIKYLIDHQHWSPFEMVNLCVEINCPRDISRQILRHRSFSFQEFSGRYAAYDAIDIDREGRLADHTNRQNSIPLAEMDVRGQETRRSWDALVQTVRDTAWGAYRSALDLGIAKEVARVLLPEGLVPTKLYVNGNIRSWWHYILVRMEKGTQKEHRDIAKQCFELLCQEYPIVGQLLRDELILREIEI